MSDDRQTARHLAPLVLFTVATAYRVEDAFSFAVLAFTAVMVTTLVLVCWRRDIDHSWEDGDMQHSDSAPNAGGGE